MTNEKETRIEDHQQALAEDAVGEGGQAMNEFEQAARASGGGNPIDKFMLARRMSINGVLQILSDEGGKTDGYLFDFIEKTEPIIEKAYSDLAATYAELVELAKASHDNITAKGMIESQYSSSLVVQQKAVESFDKIIKLLASPRIQRALFGELPGREA